MAVANIVGHIVIVCSALSQGNPRAHINDSNNNNGDTFMQSINKTNQPERVEVMALFNYSQTPCQPLSFRKRTGREVEVTELLRAQVKFVGNATKHIFDCLVGRQQCRLEFDSASLAWYLVG